jgi:hypothetical protein
MIGYDWMLLLGTHPGVGVVGKDYTFDASGQPVPVIPWNPPQLYVSTTRQDKTRQNKTKQDKRQDKTSENKTTREIRQDKTRQDLDTYPAPKFNETRQDQGRQDQGRQGKTRQDKTRLD